MQDDEENTVHGMDDGHKYKLLKFWNGCDLSKKHLSSVRDVVEIEISRASKSITDKLSELEKLIIAERAERESEDALVRQSFSIGKWATGTILTIIGLCVGYLGLKK